MMRENPIELVSLVGVLNCSGGLAWSNIHVLTCQPGCQLPTYMPLPAEEDVSSQGGLGNLNITQV